MPKVTVPAKSKESVIETAIATVVIGRIPKKPRKTQYTRLLDQFSKVEIPDDEPFIEGVVNPKSAVKPQSLVLGLRRTISRHPEFHSIKVVQVDDQVWLHRDRDHAAEVA